MGCGIVHLDVKEGERLRVLSDLHLGHPGSTIKRISQIEYLLDDIQYLILAGDTWQPIFGAVVKQSKKLLDELLRECDTRKIQVTLLQGNHDPIEDYPLVAYVYGQKYLVTHGHAIFKEGAPWAKSLRQCQHEVDEYWSCLDCDSMSLEDRLQCAQDVAKIILPRADQLKSLISIMRLPRIKPMLESWKNFPRESAEFLKLYSPETKCIVSGHFHRAGFWNVQGKDVVNTGAFARVGKILAVDFFDGGYQVRKVMRKGAKYMLSDQEITRLTIA